MQQDIEMSLSNNSNPFSYHYALEATFDKSL